MTLDYVLRVVATAVALGIAALGVLALIELWFVGLRIALDDDTPFGRRIVASVLVFAPWGLFLGAVVVGPPS